MPGTIIRTSEGSFGGPRLSVDPMLNAGSKLLIDPGHDVSPWAAGVPAVGATVPNLADAASPLVVANSLTPTSGIVERTGKGGLHAIISQVGGTTGARFNMSSQTLLDNIKANLTHAWYMSMWVVVTRQSKEATPSSLNRFAGFMSSASGDTMAIRPASGHKVTAVPSANRTSFKETASPAPLNTPIHALGSWSALGTSPGTSPELVLMGHTSASTANINTSWVLYRAYIEDLTVSAAESGKTVTDQAASVRATEESLFSAAFGSGGRYAADTRTAVSALA